MMRLDLATAEYIGTRAQQQDTAAAMPIDAGAMLVLADGLGGHESGADASRIVVDTFRDAGSKGRFDKAETRRQALRDALERANARIGEGVDPAHGHRGMASTVVAAVVAHGEMSWVSVGDSHLYVWRKGRLVKLNEDHSQAGIMVRSGQYKPGDPELQAVKSVLVSALTGRKLDIVDLPQTTFKVEVDDVLILASDGLNTLEDDEIERIVTEQRPQGAVRLSTVLLETVRSRRAPRQDNTTVAVARVLALPVRPDVIQNGHGRIGTAAEEVSVPLLLENEARTERIVPAPAPAPRPPVEDSTPPELESPSPAAVATAPPPLPESQTAPEASKTSSEDHAPAVAAEKASAAGDKAAARDAHSDGETPPRGPTAAVVAAAAAAALPPVQVAPQAHRTEAAASAQPAQPSPTPNQRPVAVKLPSQRGSGVAAQPGVQSAPVGPSASAPRAATAPPPPVSPRPQTPETDGDQEPVAKRSSLGRTLGALVLIVVLAGSIAAGAVAYLRPDWLQGLLPGPAVVERPVPSGIAPSPVAPPVGEQTPVKAQQPAGATLPPAPTRDVGPSPGPTEPVKAEPPKATAPAAADPAPAKEGPAGDDKGQAPASGSAPTSQGAGAGRAPVAEPSPQINPPTPNGKNGPAPAASGGAEPKLVEEPRPAPAPSTQPAQNSRPPRTPPPKQ